MKLNKRVINASIFIVALIVIFTIIMSSGFFSPSVVIKARAVDEYATSDRIDNLSDNINDFSFEIYNNIVKNSNGNVFSSPYSIYVALAMTYEGARDETAEQMKGVLGFEQNDEVNLCSFGWIYNLFNIDAEYTLNTANALWIMKNYPFLEEYLNFIENYYMGRATDVDFKNPSEVVGIINRWVEQNTGGKIKDMLKPQDISPETVLILSNAIYFKGLWLNKFNVENTVEKDFKITPTETVQVPIMSLTYSDESFNYSENDDMQIIELPYKGDAVSMIIILPKENNISKVEKMLNNENLSKWIDSMYPTIVDVYLPKFSFKTSYSLKNVLSDMGMDIAFSSNADFSGMNGYGDLFIEKVLHKAFIEVNEEGTEAAASTSVHMALTSIQEPNVVFNADHPFVFLIQHKETGTILFIGSVINPND